jgi:uncharacterized DUF497 family protein
MDVSFTWSGAKREANLAKHRLDFADVERVFKGETYTFEDRRFWYGEKRYITLGLFHQTPVHVVHTAHDQEIRIISFRKATRREAKTYFEEIAH